MLKGGICHGCLVREHAPKMSPKTILRSSSNSSKFEDDEFTGFAENNTKIPNAKEERAVFPNGMEKYNWYWAARQMPKTLFTREEIQEFKRWIKLKKHYQGKERKQTVECWLMGRFVLIFRIFFWCVNKFARVSNTESAHSDANEFVPNNKGSSTIGSSVYSGCYFSTLLKTEMYLAEKFWASVPMQINLFLARQLQLPYS